MLSLLLFICGAIICCYSQKYFVISNWQEIEAHGCYQLALTKDVKFEEALINTYVAEHIRKGKKEPRIVKYYKQMSEAEQSQLYYLVFWSCLKLDRSEWKQADYWMLVKPPFQTKKKRMPLEYGYCHPGLIPIQNQGNSTIFVDIGPMIQTEVSWISNLFHRQCAKYDELQRQKHNDSILQRREDEMSLTEIIELKNLSAKVPKQRDLINKESKDEAAIVYIVIIVIISIVCMVLLIIVICYCVSRKSEKNRVQQMHSFAINPEPQINRRNESRNVRHIKKRNGLKNKLRLELKTQIKQKGDGTAMGRFEPERFSDAINNLPAVQDAVLDGIMDEMQTEGMKSSSETKLEICHH